MLRFAHYKYIYSAIYDEEREILFDLKVDPDETTNVFGQPGYAGCLARARRT